MNSGYSENKFARVFQRDFGSLFVVVIINFWLLQRAFSRRTYTTAEAARHILEGHTCQVLRFGHSHYGFLDKLKTTGIVGKDYGFMLVWRCNFFGNHFITFSLFLDEVMGLSQYC